jgi:hypothetical protein
MMHLFGLTVFSQRILSKTQLDDWESHVHGYFNFANKRQTQHNSWDVLWFMNNRSYWYTGLTSVGADEGSSRFCFWWILTENKWYRQTGATEYAALRQKEKSRKKGHDSSFPITYNINGVPTYVMSLKDNSVD